MVMSSLPIGTNYVKLNNVLVKLKYLPKKINQLVIPF